MMALPQSASLGVGLATAGLVYAIHSQATPTMADIRVGSPNDPHIDNAERAATVISIGVVSAVSLLAKDPTIFIIGGGMAVIMAWWTRHANTLNPTLGLPSMEGTQRVEVPQSDTGMDDTGDYLSAA